MYQLRQLVLKNLSNFIPKYVCINTKDVALDVALLVYLNNCVR